MAFSTIPRVPGGYDATRGAEPSADERRHHEAVISWAGEAIKEAEAFLRSQPGYDKIDDITSAIMGEYGVVKPSTLSNITDNHIGKIALDLVASLTDIKPFFDFRTYNAKFDRQAAMLNKLALSWWTNRFIDLKFSDVIKFAVAMASGYAHQVYNTDTHDLDLLAEDPRDVLPIRPGSLFSIQDAFGVLLRRERPVNYLQQKYPGAARFIKPDRDSTNQASQMQTRAYKLMQAMGLRSSFLENLYASLGGRPQARLMNIPTTDEFTLYVKDDAINRTGGDVVMGDPEKNWSYIVKPGEALYPRKRCIVFTRTAVLYDGPNPYWHGLFPLSKLTLDPWPWTWLGKSPLKDLLPLQEQLNRDLRVVADHNERVGRPGVIADKNSVSRALMERLDTRRSGLKVRQNPIAGQGMQLVHEPPLDPSIKENILFLIQQMKELSGVQDLQQISQLNQFPAAETIEKMLEAMSPSIRLRSRVMECFLRETAMMSAMNFFQFYTLTQRLAVLGPSGLTFEDFDFDPGTLIPDFVHDTDFDHVGNIKPESLTRGPLPRYERARTFIRNFTFHIAPGSLLAASEITRKLLYLQLARAGLIDHWTLLEVLGVPNVGDPPDGADSITDRLQAEQQVGIGMAVNPVGRKASGQAMPQMKITES